MLTTRPLGHLNNLHILFRDVWSGQVFSVHESLHSHVCVCVYVCEREREIKPIKWENEAICGLHKSYVWIYH